MKYMALPKAIVMVNPLAGFAMMAVALGTSVYMGVQAAVPAVLEHFAGSQAEARQMVQDVTVREVQAAVRESMKANPVQRQVLDRKIEEVVLSETRDGTRALIAKVQLPDGPEFTAKIQDVVLVETKDGVRRQLAQIDPNALILSALSEPAAVQQLLGPLSAELPAIVGSKLDVNGLMSEMMSDPALRREFMLTLAHGLVAEIGKDVDFNPIVAGLLADNQGLLGQFQLPQDPLASLFDSPLSRFRRD